MDALQLGGQPAGVGRYVRELLWSLSSVLSEREHVTAFVSDAALSALPASGGNLRLVAQPAERGARRILRQQFVLPRHMRRRFHVVHYPDYLVPLWRRPRPFTVTLHDVAYAIDPAYFTFGQRVLRRGSTPVAARAADHIIVDSHFTRSEVLRLFPDVAPDSVTVVHPGVSELGPPAEAGGVRARYGLFGRYVLSVCTLEPRKNIARLIEAFRRPELADEVLVLAGREGWGVERIHQLGSGPDLQGRLVVTGYLSDGELATLYKHATAFAYPSLYEGFGFPVLEAMQAGLPVLASDIPVLHETAGDAVVFVDPRSPEHMAVALRALLDDAEKRARLVEQGRRVVQRFSWRSCAAATLEVYREVARSHSGTASRVARSPDHPTLSEGPAPRGDVALRGMAERFASSYFTSPSFLSSTPVLRCDMP